MKEQNECWAVGNLKQNLCVVTRVINEPMLAQVRRDAGKIIKKTVL
jgi:hypothetical protein